MTASEAEPTLAIRNNLYGLGADMVFMGPTLPSVRRMVRVATDLGESRPLPAATAPAGDGKTILRIAHIGPATSWLRLEDARFLEIREGDRAIVRLPLDIPAAGAGAVRDCQARALAEAGFGADIVEEPRPAPGAPVVTAATGTAAALSGGNPGAWVSDADYPAAARREGRGGTVGVLLKVEPDGRVGRCFVGLSSGSPDLDEATCRAVSARGRWTSVEGKPRLSRLYFSWSPS